MQKLENNIADQIQSEVEKVVATVETRVHEAILSAMDNLVVPWSVGISMTRIPSSIVSEPDQGDFSGDTNGLQMAVRADLTQMQI